MRHIPALKLFLQNQLRVVKKVAFLIVSCCFIVLWHGPMGRHLTFLEKRAYKTQEAAESPLGNVQRANTCGTEPLFLAKKNYTRNSKNQEQNEQNKKQDLNLKAV